MITCQECGLPLDPGKNEILLCPRCSTEWVLEEKSPRLPVLPAEKEALSQISTEDRQNSLSPSSGAALPEIPLNSIMKFKYNFNLKYLNSLHPGLVVFFIYAFWVFSSILCEEKGLSGIFVTIFIAIFALSICFLETFFTIDRYNKLLTRRYGFLFPFLPGDTIEIDKFDKVMVREDKSSNVLTYYVYLEGKTRFEITDPVIKKLEVNTSQDKIKTLQSLKNKNFSRQELEDSLKKSGFTKNEINMVMTSVKIENNRFLLKVYKLVDDASNFGKEVARFLSKKYYFCGMNKSVNVDNEKKDKSRKRNKKPKKKRH